MASADSLFLSGAFVILVSTLTGYAVESSFLPPDIRTKLYPALLWIVFLFVATAHAERSFDKDAEYDGFQGLLLAGTSPHLLFLSRTLILFLKNSCIFLILELILAQLMSVGVHIQYIKLLIFVSPVLLSYTSLASLLSVLTHQASARSVVLPLILFPLLFPILAGGIELSYATMLSQPLSLWLFIEIGLSIALFLIGLMLFPAAIGR